MKSSQKKVRTEIFSNLCITFIHIYANVIFLISQDFTVLYDPNVFVSIRMCSKQGTHLTTYLLDITNDVVLHADEVALALLI